MTTRGRAHFRMKVGPRGADTPPLSEFPSTGGSDRARSLSRWLAPTPPRPFVFVANVIDPCGIPPRTFQKKSGAAMNDTTTSTGATVDPETGEVRDAAPRRRRRVLTDEQRAERDRVLAERADLRRAELAALRAIDPACETEDDPPVVWRAPVRMGGEPNGVRLDLPRVSGRGLPGSRLVLAERYYDGAGPNGGMAHHAVTGFVRYLDAQGAPRRTVGLQIHRAEGRAVVATLTRWLDELDTRDAKGAP